SGSYPMAADGGLSARGATPCPLNCLPLNALRGRGSKATNHCRARSLPRRDQDLRGRRRGGQAGQLGQQRLDVRRAEVRFQVGEALPALVDEVAGWVGGVAAEVVGEAALLLESGPPGLGEGRLQLLRRPLLDLEADDEGERFVGVLHPGL